MDLNDKEQPTPAPAQSQSHGWEILAYGGAIFASAMSIYVQVRQNFYWRLRRGVLKSLDTDRTAKLEALGRRLDLGILSPENYKTELKEIKKLASERWDLNVERMGIERGFKGFCQRFDNINKFEKLKTIGIGLTVLSVSMCTILSLRQRWTQAERITRLEQVHAAKEPEGISQR